MRDLHPNQDGVKMDRETARRIVQVATDFDKNITKLYNLSEDVRDQDLQNRIRDCANTIMGLLNRDVIVPLVHIYPDIDPDG